MKSYWIGLIVMISVLTILLSGCGAENGPFPPDLDPNPSSAAMVK